MEHFSKRLLKEGIFRQMDLHNANLPDEIPSAALARDGDSKMGFKLLYEQIPAFVTVDNGSETHSASGGEWNTKMLGALLKDQLLKVAVTPFGNADAPLHDEAFVEPASIDIKFDDLVTRLRNVSDRSAVYYMQSQDDNMKQFDSLNYNQPALRHLFGEPEAVNLWIGGSGTVSRLHNDNYENIYHQVDGYKIIYLIPPSNVFYTHEKFLMPAKYAFNKENRTFDLLIGDSSSASAKLNAIDNTALQLKEICNNLEKQAKVTKILFPTQDPSTIKDPACRVYKVLLCPGDYFYIPALWYHQIEIPSASTDLQEFQVANHIPVITEPNVSISVNSWFTPTSTSSLWANWDFLRYTSLMVRDYHDEDYFWTTDA